ncbi:hypothetical protein PILCRDRAFT_829012 [Piloderma croceum F 1598]|uniref:Uncharacterized protein n=1 Tax=Piloderma croceum (strain F 1598) TaxID=765440 RepID=A0A0C3EM23_PILCF|nr:hypothetical protein PILCRDRAFT_829012 [Piloderma croceum F 1598]
MFTFVSNHAESDTLIIDSIWFGLRADPLLQKRSCSLTPSRPNPAPSYQIFHKLHRYLKSGGVRMLSRSPVAMFVVYLHDSSCISP